MLCCLGVIISMSQMNVCAATAARAWILNTCFAAPEIFRYTDMMLDGWSWSVEVSYRTSSARFFLLTHGGEFWSGPRISCDLDLYGGVNLGDKCVRVVCLRQGWSEWWRRWIDSS